MLLAEQRSERKLKRLLWRCRHCWQPSALVDATDEHRKWWRNHQSLRCSTQGVRYISFGVLEKHLGGDALLNSYGKIEFDTCCDGGGQSSSQVKLILSP
jgi:hypothetical protein